MQGENITAPAEVMTKLDAMNLTDRFLFDETVEELDIFNLIVDIILNGKIILVGASETEKELRISPELRSIRLDVIATDEAGNVFRMEMQKKNT